MRLGHGLDHGPRRDLAGRRAGGYGPLWDALSGLGGRYGALWNRSWYDLSESIISTRVIKRSGSKMVVSDRNHGPHGRTS